MMRASAASRLLSSPGSPNGPLSGAASPETRITPFSPENARLDRVGSTMAGRPIGNGLPPMYAA